MKTSTSLEENRTMFEDHKNPLLKRELFAVSLRKQKKVELLKVRRDKFSK